MTTKVLGQAETTLASELRSHEGVHSGAYTINTFEKFYIRNHFQTSLAF